MLRTEEELITENTPLIKFMIKKMKLFPTASADYEDLVSIGKIGLIVAAKKYDSSNGYSFSTYACRCIFMEFCSYLKREKKNPITCSLDEQIPNAEGINYMELKEVNQNYGRNIEEIVEADAEFTDVVNIILNCLDSRDRLIMLYYLAGFKQIDIANIVNTSQLMVSRVERRITKKIEEGYYDRKNMKRIFLMEIVNNKYDFSFFINNMENNNMVLSNILKQLEKDKEALRIEVSKHKNYITISVPRNRQAFYIIAKFIQRFEEVLEYLSSI